jgi:hypothetical protein
LSNHKAGSLAILAAFAFAIVAGYHARLTGAQTAPPSGYSHFTPAVSLWVDGDNVVIQANAIPNHNSPYFPTSDPRWEAYNGTNPNWAQNPNHIASQVLEFRIPANPQAAATHAATPLGPIGVAINGVPLFNQYAGPNQPLTNEINSFDQYDGHPQQTNMYHYHVEPYALTSANGKDSLIGYLLDGFPVYGPEENGVTITNADLDQYHGHFGVTADYPQGIYHYHVTAAAPYINGTGFYGTAGTVSTTFSATPTPSSASPTPTATIASSVGGISLDPDMQANQNHHAATSSDGDYATYGLAAAILIVAVLGAFVWNTGRR